MADRSDKDNPVFVVEKDDLQKADKLLSEVYSTSPGFWMSRFEHWWDDNPAWSSKIPRGWAINDDSGRMLGFMAAIPFNYRRSGQIVRASALSTLGVHPSMRGRGIAKRIGEVALQQDVDLIIGTQSSEAAWRMWMSLGMAELPENWPRNCRLMVGDAAAFASKILEWKNIGSSAARKAVPAAANLVAEITSRVTRPRAGGVALELSSGFSEHEADDLSKLIAKPAAIVPERDVKTLNWIYHSGRIHCSRYVVVARREGRIVGYIGLREHQGAAFMIECRIHPGESKIINLLLWAARDLAKREGFPYVIVYCYSREVERSLPSLLSLPAPKSHWFTYCYKVNMPGLNIAEVESGPWDGDSPVL